MERRNINIIHTYMYLYVIHMCVGMMKEVEGGLGIEAGIYMYRIWVRKP